MMSVPSSSSNKITDNKPGGTSPSPIEGIEGVPGPSSLEPMHSLLTQDEESEDYGEDGEEEEEDDSSEEDSEASVISIRATLFCKHYTFVNIYTLMERDQFHFRSVIPEYFAMQNVNLTLIVIHVHFHHRSHSRFRSEYTVPFYTHAYPWTSFSHKGSVKAKLNRVYLVKSLTRKINPTQCECDLKKEKKKTKHD